MGVNNIRSAVFEDTMQSPVHTVIKSRPFAQVSDLYPSLFQHTVEVAFQPPPERDDYGLIPLTVQSRHDVNCQALRTAGAQQRNDMKHFDFVHEQRFVYRFEMALLE